MGVLRVDTGTFYSGAIPNVMFRKMVDKLHVRIMPTNRRIKVANCAFEKCVGHLGDVPIQMGELVETLEFFVIESSQYDELSDYQQGSNSELGLTIIDARSFDRHQICSHE